MPRRLSRRRLSRALRHALRPLIIIAASVILAGAAPGTPSAARAAAKHARRSGSANRKPTTRPIDWDKLTKEAAALLSHYIRIDTSNPPGNELAAARMLREKFLADGIPATVWEPASGGAVVAARLRGIGKHTKAIVLLSHMGVAPADAKLWKLPPFSGEVKNGEIWGRGAIEGKGPGVVDLMAMLAIKRAGMLLHRDVLFVATGDGAEAGHDGARWFVDHEEKIYADAGGVLDQGGGIRLTPRGHRFYAVSVTEKTPLWIKLSAHGDSGRGAAPPRTTALTHLVAALNRLVAYRPPIRIINPVRDYFRTIARLDGGPRKFRDLVHALRKPRYRREFTANPRYNAMVRDTIAPTMLGASAATNVISPTAWAVVDCRLLPGENRTRFLDRLRHVIDDKTIKIQILLNLPSLSSPSRSILMKAIDSLARQDGNTSVVPTMALGFTDNRYFRAKHITSYGFIPMELTPAEERTVDRPNERIGIKQLGDGIRRMVELLRLAGRS